MNIINKIGLFLITTIAILVIVAILYEFPTIFSFIGAYAFFGIIWLYWPGELRKKYAQALSINNEIFIYFILWPFSMFTTFSIWNTIRKLTKAKKIKR